MKSNNTLKCPVCGSPAAKTARSTTCKVCGAKDALVTAFAGQRAYDAWAAEMQQFAHDWNTRKIHAGQENYQLILGGDRVVFLNRRKQQLLQVSHYEDARILRNYKCFSAGKLHWAGVNGSDVAMISGNNDYGQCGAAGATEVESVLAAPRCTYLVKKDGTVAVSGASAARETVSGWKDVRLLCSVGTNAVVGLTRQGRLMSTDDKLHIRISGWDNVVDVAASGYVLALHADGTVSCAGNEEIARQVRDWPEVTAIAADSQYAVGLTPEGKVLLAGQTPFMDMGRSEAATWENVICIAASPQGSLIGGVTVDGRLLLAGLSVDGEAVCQSFAKNVAQLL